MSTVNQTNPHFGLPFDLTSGATTNEQDTLDDIAACVEAICRTPQGSRLDNLDFGFPNVELSSQPIVTEDLIDIVSEQEPRAVLLFEEQPDLLDYYIDRITITVQEA